MDYYDYLNGIEVEERLEDIHSSLHGLIDAIYDEESDIRVEMLADRLSIKLLLVEMEVGHTHIKPYKDLYTKIVSEYRLKNFRDGLANGQETV